MKKLILLITVAAFSMSCSDDDSTTSQENEPFFNLTEGNLWVYNRYTVNDDTPGIPPQLIGKDSVKIVGQEVYEGLPYYRVEHWESGVDSNNSYMARSEYWRINDEGHLVWPNGYVVHPGHDSTYEHSGPFEIASMGEVGNMNNSVSEIENIEIEGQIYSAVPYTGYFIPSINVPEGIGFITSYQAGLGMVFQRCRYLGANSFLEYRLVSYDLN